MYGQRTAFDIAFTLVKLCKSIFVQRRKKRKGERKKPARERRVSDAQLGREMSARENRRNIIDKQRRGGGKRQSYVGICYEKCIFYGSIYSRVRICYIGKYLLQ